MVKILSISPNDPPEGRHVTLGKTVYHFAPNERGHNVCEVTDQAHIDRLLSIPEGYRRYEGKPVPPPQVPEIVKPLDLAKRKRKGSAEPVEAGSAPANAPPTPQAKAPAPNNYNGLTRKQLEAAYKKKFGKKPNSRAKDDTLVAQLSAEG